MKVVVNVHMFTGLFKGLQRFSGFLIACAQEKLCSKRGGLEGGREGRCAGAGPGGRCTYIRTYVMSLSYSVREVGGFTIMQRVRCSALRLHSMYHRYDMRWRRQSSLEITSHV